MPRDSNGVYSLPPGYLAVTGQTIEASQHNPPLEDLGAAMTGSMPRNGSAPMLGDLTMGGSKVTALGTGTAPSDAVRKDQMDAAIAAAIAAITPSIQPIPPGTIAMSSANVVPAGWFECNGAAVSRATYAALFLAIGTRYGGGDGSTTFNLPDCRGRFPRYLDTGSGLDPGRSLGSYQDQDLQTHGHNTADPGHVHGPGSGSQFQNITSGTNFPDTIGGGLLTATSSTTAAAATGISILPTGGPETRPRNIAFWAIIKV